MNWQDLRSVNGASLMIGSLARTSEITHKDGTFRVAYVGVFSKFSKQTFLEERLILHKCSICLFSLNRPRKLQCKTPSITKIQEAGGHA